MAHHGHKTEEQKHVLINLLSAKELKGAQGRKSLCLFFAILAMVCFSGAAKAQVYSTNSPANTEIRIQQLEDQLQQLTGRVEEQNHALDQMQQKFMDLQNAQIKAQSDIINQAIPAQEEPSVVINPSPILAIEPPKIEGMKTTAPKGEEAKAEETSLNSGDATAQYEQAFASLKAKDYDAAQSEFESFLEEHKDHELVSNAKYWLGETYYVRGNYKNAAKVFAEGFQKFPNSAKSPDMLLKLGMSLVGMDKVSDACVALSQVPVKFPTGNAEVLKTAASEMARLNCGS